MNNQNVMKMGELRQNIERTWEGVKALNCINEKFFTAGKEDLLLQLNRALVYLYRQMADLIEQEIKDKSV